MILYINSCVREGSRTDTIARVLLEKLGGEVEELVLSEAGLKPLDRETLAARTEKIIRRELDAPEFRLARQFAAADTIVIAAPFWDLSFPSLLKLYLENIYVTGIVSRYSEKGIPEGLCRASKLYYVTTAGGPYEPTFSYDYIRDLAVKYFGIGETKLIFAQMLDVAGFDAQAILQETLDALEV